LAVTAHNGRAAAIPAIVALACLVLAPAAAWTAEPPANVLDVVIKGNQQMSTAAVLTNVKTRPGQPFNEQVVREDERRLLESGRYDSVIATRQQTDKGIIVTFTVSERALVKTVGFTGNKAYKDEKLRPEVPLKNGDPFSDFGVENSRRAIEKFYNSNGYHFVTVSVDKEALKDRRVIYEITEGPNTVVRKVRFEGNTFFELLKLKMTVGTKRRFWPFVEGRLDAEQVAQDVMALRNLYVAEGFLDAEVGRVLDFTPDRASVTVTFAVKEGQRYRVNKAVFQGAVVFSEEELQKRIRLGQGEFFTELTLKRDLEKLRNTYGELGYIEAKVEAKRQFIDPTAPPPEWAQHLGKPALLNVVFTIQESDQYRVAKVVIRGNSTTQDRVIRRELRVYPEQLFDSVSLERSKKRLMETRLFQKVEAEPTGTGPKVRDALVEVTEGRTAEFMVGVGVSTNSGLLGTISFTQRNFNLLAWATSWNQFIKGEAFKGAGQTLRIVAEPGTELMRFSIEWFEPSLMDQPYSLGNRLFLFTRQRESYQETRVGDVVSVGHTFKNRWYGELATRVEDVTVDSLEHDAPPEVRDVEGSNLLVGFKGSLTRDRTDSRWNPSEGDRLTFSAEQVVGSFNFLRLQGDYHRYWTVYTDAMDRKHIIAARLSAGDIIGDSPVFENFYGGGIGSIRGFRYRGISPRSAGTDQAIGGKFMFFAGAEYSFPIFGTGDGHELRGVTFLDTGTVEEDFGLSTYRASVGFGVRWVIPFFGPVPMAFDFGFPIAKDTNDDTQVFSFSLGWTF
jgi:outer membrane protein insertion porin family